MLTIDVNQSKSFTTSGQNNMVTNSFTTTKPNELILVLISNGNTVTGVTDTAGLTYHQVQAQLAQNAENGIIYYAWAKSVVTNNQITVAAGSAQEGQVTVLSFIGADSRSGDGASAIGANNGGGAASGTVQLSLTTTRNGSWIFGCFGLGTNATAVAQTNQTILGQSVDGIFTDTCSTMENNAVTPAAGTSVTLGLTNTGVWNGAIVEILPAVYPAEMPLLNVG